MRLERVLNEPPGPVRYEVLNLGIAGLNAGAVVARFSRIGMTYEPDLVVYGYTLNDIEGPAYRTSADTRKYNVQGNLSSHCPT